MTSGETSLSTYVSRHVSQDEIYQSFSLLFVL